MLVVMDKFCYYTLVVVQDLSWQLDSMPGQVLAYPTLTAANQRHDFNIIARADQVRGVLLAGNDFGVDFDGQIVWRNVDGVKQLFDRHRGLDFDTFAVDGDFDHRWV